jgi:CheY-like chemotaxis protein
MGDRAPVSCLRRLGACWRRPPRATPAHPAPPASPSPDPQASARDKAARSSAALAEGPPPSASGAPSEALWRILIVEDDVKVAEMIHAALRLEGNGSWEIRAALTGEEALSIVAAQSVDLILLDVRLPGISGAEVYRRLRAAPGTQRLPIIFLSGGTAFDLSLEGLQEGILLRKPFNVSELLAVVRANLPATPGKHGEAAGG